MCSGPVGLADTNSTSTARGRLGLEPAPRAGRREDPGHGRLERRVRQPQVHEPGPRDLGRGDQRAVGTRADRLGERLGDVQRRPPQRPRELHREVGGEIAERRVRGPLDGDGRPLDPVLDRGQRPRPRRPRPTPGPRRRAPATGWRPGRRWTGRGWARIVSWGSRGKRHRSGSSAASRTLSPDPCRQAPIRPTTRRPWPSSRSSLPGPSGGRCALAPNRRRGSCRLGDNWSVRTSHSGFWQVLSQGRAWYVRQRGASRCAGIDSGSPRPGRDAQA